MKKVSLNLNAVDIVVGILFIFLSATAFYITTTWIPPILPGDPGAAFFPRIAIGVILIFSIVLIFQRMISGRQSPETTVEKSEAVADKADKIEVEPKPFFVALAFSAVLVFLIDIIKFELAGFAFLFTLLGMRTKRWIWATIVSVIAVLIMYFVFVVVLKVRLPLLFLSPYLSLF